MQNIKLTLQYDGTRYLGWKRPEKDHNDRTVSYKIENVLEKVTGTPVTLIFRSPNRTGSSCSESHSQFSYGKPTDSCRI